MAPKVLIPIVLLLALATTGLGFAYAMKEGGSNLIVETCTIGDDPNCALRAPAHGHADFALFVDGERLSFDREEFLSTEEEEVSPYAHIHAPRTNVVHYHYSNTTWDAFLSSLGFTLIDQTVPGGGNGNNSLTLPDGTVLREEDGKTLKFIVNDMRVDGIAFENIADLDRVLISYGDETVEEVFDQQWPLLSDESCITSGRCADRIPPNEPPEPCFGKGACTG